MIRRGDNRAGSASTADGHVHLLRGAEALGVDDGDMVEFQALQPQYRPDYGTTAGPLNTGTHLGLNRFDGVRHAFFRDIAERA